jgi:tetratricopeptide (TPR) repeat protein
VHHAVLHDVPPPPSSLVPGLGAEYDAVCDWLLRKPVSERPASAAAALDALEALRRGASSGSSPGGAAGPLPARTTLRRNVTIGAGVVIALLVATGWLWSRFGPGRVPEAARTWYERGVEALRESSYATARSRFEFAIGEYPDYALAHARLAEALTELDDLEGAMTALLRVNDAVVRGARLSREDQTRFDAVQASARRDHAQAIRLYRDLVTRAPREAARWVDVGRAEEAASRRVEARDAYRRAVELDPAYAAARLRLGVMQAQDGDAAGATASFDEAERLFRAATNVEGEAETSLRRSVMLLNRGDMAGAEAAVTPVVKLGEDARFEELGLRARFQLARVEARKGNFERAEALASTAVREATDRGLQTLAAKGLIDAGLASLSARRYDEAAERTARAERLAADRKALLTETRARLQMASIKDASGESAEALRLAEAVLPFFDERQHVRNAAEARIIASRAHEALGNLDDAARLARAVVDVADSIKDLALKATALETLAGSAVKSGRLGEALAHREAIEREHEKVHDDLSLAFDLRSRADLLITMGRTRDAQAALDVTRERAEEGRTPYVSGRVPVLQARLALVEGRFSDVASATAAAGTSEANARSLRAMAEFGRARLGLRGEPAALIEKSPEAATAASSRHELAWWAAVTLLARRDFRRALAVSSAVLTGADAPTNPEVAWRIAAVAAAAARQIGPPADAAAFEKRAREDMRQLFERWGARESDRLTYLARSDLAEVRDIVK